MKEKLPRRGKRSTNTKGDRPVPAVQGLKYVRLVGTLLQALHDEGTERDRAGNRQLFFDQYAMLLLLYFFTPTVTSLRGIQQMSELNKVQQRWGVPRTGVSTLRGNRTPGDEH